ncbi:alpha/beta hydrolase|uniref:alpha/beta hydrolase n=1 Tax=Noviherbaspirillum sp. L7-7A TaxID=2850560 RepID=UPI001C2BFAF1|nr:alpha/beta hydrolase [Noviherbaspirillum sp. L7-7A]MBV0878544.1 alpha/beta hydrolase [Noviherbaspirillum sp. L7-7A]
MNLVYIHGNHATADSFNFIRSKLSGYNDILLEYDSAHGFYTNHATMLERLAGKPDLFFIAHSLGGIHALHLAAELGDQVRGGVTMSTPYGGSEAAEMVACLMPFSQVLQDIRPRSAPILDGKRIALNVPWTNLVTTAGASPFMLAANDGVVTHDSMRNRDDIQLVDIACNHFEIVLNQDALTVIQSEIAQVEQRKVARAPRDRSTFSLARLLG